MNVIPMTKTIPDTMSCRFNCNNQYTKNRAFRIKNKGKISVNTDKIGKNLGAKKGKT